MSAGGRSVSPDHHFEGMGSTIFDSLYIPSGSHVSSLMKQGRVIHWVRKAIGHCEALSATGEGVSLVKSACEFEEMVFTAGAVGEDVVDSFGAVTATKVGNPNGMKDALKMVKGARTNKQP